jgi:hypothetical protein
MAVARRSGAPPEADPLAVALGERPGDAGLGAVGIEHEFVVRAGGSTVDARRLLSTLDIAGRRIDPGDPRAIRTATGVAITSDGAEAEVAVPPVPLGPGAVPELRSWAGSAHAQLADALPRGHELEGVSTHVSASIHDEHADRAASLFARTFAPALMLLVDRPDSPGLLVRPRAGRLELGGDYVTGRALEAAVAMAAGGTRLCEAAVAGRRPPAELPPPVRIRVEAAIDRYGRYVGRHAPGADLYRGGRRARLTLVDGRVVDAQTHLELAWKSARAALDDVVDPGDLAAADDLVAGLHPLPTERPGSRRPDPGPIRRSPTWGRAIEWTERPGYRLTAVRMTWSSVVFALVGTRPLYANVPTEWLSSFFDRLDAGELDAVFLDQLGRPPGSWLNGFSQTPVPGIFDGVAPDRWALAPPERDATGTFRRPDDLAATDTRTGQGDDASLTRPGKAGGGSTPVVGPTGEPRRPRRRWTTGLAVLLAALVGAGLLAALLGGDDPADDGPPEAPGGDPATAVPGPAGDLPADLVALSRLLTDLGVGPDRIAGLGDEAERDPTGDWIYSIPGVAPGDPGPDVDIARTWVGRADLTADQVEDLFDATRFPCGATGARRVACPPGPPTPVPPGEVVLAATVLEATVPDAAPDRRYVYAAAFESDGEASDDYVARPPFEWDFFAGTDRWYQLVGVASGATRLDVSDGPSGPVPSAARAVVDGATVLFVIPGSELPAPRGVRLTAFRHDGSFAPEASAGDVDGSDPTGALLPVPP